MIEIHFGYTSFMYCKSSLVLCVVISIDKIGSCVQGQMKLGQFT